MDLKTSIMNAINEYNIDSDDILYISYYMGHYLQTRQRFYCTLSELFGCPLISIVPLDRLLWLHEMVIVGSAWWLNYDPISNTWMMNNLIDDVFMPTRPRMHRVPVGAAMVVHAASWHQTTHSDDDDDDFL